MAHWFQRFIQAINTEYDRRIRRASQITEYGPHHATHQNDDEDEGEVEIVNVPRGTSVAVRDNHSGEKS